MEKFKPNSKYFKNPTNKILNRFVLMKYEFLSNHIFTKEPCVFLTPKTADIDKNLITKSIKNKFVFLNDEILSSISKNNISQKEINSLLDAIQELSLNNYSLAVVYGNQKSLFGECEILPEFLIKFLVKTGLNLKYLTFPGLYFSQPIWSNSCRRTKIYTNQQLTIKNNLLKGLTEDEIVSSIQNYHPSSATTYLNKFPITINSNNLACGFERILYCCPNCKELLSLYSEFSCIKCRSCGMAIEFSSDGKILFSKNINTFDDVDSFQFNTLTKKDLTINKIAEYEKVTQTIKTREKKQVKILVNLQIFADKFIIINSLTNKKTTIIYEDVNECLFDTNNSFYIKTKNAKEYLFNGNSNENFVIIRDLIRINQN